MLDAVSRAHFDGADRTVVIGTDCPALTAGHLERAFQALETSDAVLGPTHDGGYYLIGLRRPEPELFSEIAWSTEAVLTQTRSAADGLGLRVALLDTLHDLDNADDLHRARSRSGLPL